MEDIYLRNAKIMSALSTPMRLWLPPRVCRRKFR